MRIAIVGSGVTGLVAAHELHREHEITLLEQDDYLGGHARTVVVEEEHGSVAVDVGFIVFNRENYPQFTRLLDQLGVASQPSEMSFGMRCRGCRIDYSSRGLSGLLARPSQAVRPRIYRMAADILRFNRWARQQPTGGLEAKTIGSLKQTGRFGQDLFNHYLVPMTGAIWSSTGTDVDDMPLEFLLSFYRNHGLLQTQGHPQWRTVVGGSARYVNALTRPFRSRVRLRTPVRSIRRRAGHVELKTDDGWEQFDRVVLATHTDQALRVLDDATGEERDLLSSIPYRRNDAVLHTDDRLLSSATRARASWNCHVDDCRAIDAPLRMTYDLTRLMALHTAKRYCVTLNDDGRVAADRVLARMTYAHPLYTAGSLVARRRLQILNTQHRGAVFCGAYLGNGFHEDGVRAGIDAAAWIRERRVAA